MKYKRIFTIVMDSVGCGEMPDAERYGDRGADTIGHIAKTVGGLTMPAMEKLGYGNLHPILGVEPQRDPQGYYTKMLEASVGKDTMTGHWEMMGLYIDKPFQTFTETGFPQELIDELEKRTGYKIVGNKSASGTEILDELGEHHMKTKELIIYTSADSVLQIAAHEEIFGLEELYRCCEIARELTMRDEWKVGRVIARPFVGEGKGHFTRTSNRHDLALKPFGRTVLNELKDRGFDVISVGKIKDIFDGEGVSEAYKSTSSHHGMEQTLELTQKDFTGLCFVNLVDFDAKWGHRRNPQGYAQELEDYDQLLQNFLSQLREDDLVIITADHGNDPCHTGTDHTREMVPLILYSPSHQGSGLLPLANTFANLGATVADNFKVTMPAYGTSYLKFLK
ncbi:phosphopentomutase [Holdemania massiliensis]|uniref:phosphopentomutase n=1 Tax=Holdemania massiliensis TaxID=1468449 RepID=UPI001F06CA70|nr:phosphopentomutase [Holdemania massiliensis]MCH1940911.1 phosphopentomutase [Holdemania massiliensis]